MFSTYPLAWFESKIDQVIYRNNKPFPIKSKDDATYCHTLQSSGFSFTPSPEVKKPRIHLSDRNCVACEG